MFSNFTFLLIFQSPMPSTKKPRSSQNCERKELLRKATRHIENLAQKEESDEADTYAKGWACSYRKLSVEQKLFAKKACDEIFILGQLEKLTLDSVQTQTSTYPPRHAIYKPISQTISMSDVSNSASVSQSTPIQFSSSSSPQIIHVGDADRANRVQYSSFQDLLSDVNFN